jgi:hypothetical protein
VQSPFDFSFGKSRGISYCPLNLGFMKSRLEEKKWHITTDGRSANGVSGKKRRKGFYGNVVLTRIPLRKSVFTTGRILMPPDGSTAI